MLFYFYFCFFASFLLFFFQSVDVIFYFCEASDSPPYILIFTNCLDGIGMNIFWVRNIGQSLQSCILCEETMHSTVWVGWRHMMHSVSWLYWFPAHCRCQSWVTIILIAWVIIILVAGVNHGLHDQHRPSRSHRHRHLHHGHHYLGSWQGGEFYTLTLNTRFKK